ncbi:hypothetical protein [Prevotella merdae]|uniref:hypothetical protein n=1 Tax=Prevotella merdae TaxID=2079531 RepID=UPI003569AA53
MNNTEIINHLNGNGLLIRTVQTKYLADEFKDISDSIDAAVVKYTKDSNYYGPKRRWSIAQKDLKPIFFKMDKETSFVRDFALICVPSLIDWNNYVEFSTTDNSSNSKFISGEKTMSADVAKQTYHKTLTELKNNVNLQNQNNEVVTCGFKIDAFCGILVRPEAVDKLEEVKQQLEKAKQQLEKAKNNILGTMSSKEIHFFKFDRAEKTNFTQVGSYTLANTII